MTHSRCVTLRRINVSPQIRMRFESFDAQTVALTLSACQPVIGNDHLLSAIRFVAAVYGGL